MKGIQMEQDNMISETLVRQIYGFAEAISIARAKEPCRRVINWQMNVDGIETFSASITLPEPTSISRYDTVVGQGPSAKLALIDLRNQLLSIGESTISDLRVRSDKLAGSLTAIDRMTGK